MSSHKYLERICWICTALAVLLTVLFMNGEALGIGAASRTMGYEKRLFDTSAVHTIDIVMDDWDSFIENCENEEYAVCSVIIDGEAFKNIGIRAKGNTSLSSVSSMNSDRYSFKLEFDQYESGKSYYGLDKLSLNNLIQDNTFMKDFLVYEMMRKAGAAAPLCSFVRITVGGSDWGLYLAVEGVEDSFLQRNYGTDHGDLYKPDSLSFGGGRGNGKGFDMENFDFEALQSPEENGGFEMPEDFELPDMGGFPFGGNAGGQMPDIGDFRIPEDSSGSEKPGSDNVGENGPAGGRGGFGGMGSSDVKLQYTDDDPESYSNIFGSAKTDVTSADEKRLIAALKALSEQDAENSVDIDAVLRYFVVHNFVVNGDSYTGNMIHNYYLYEEDGLLTILPWDYNLAYGTFRGGGAESAVNDPIDLSGMEDRPMAYWIFADEEYTEPYHQYFSEFLASAVNSGWLEELIDSTVSLIDPYVQEDPTKFCTYEQFLTGAETLKEFCLLRAESVSGQLSSLIPSTGSGQAADGSTLIDTGSLDLSLMGTMGMGGGKGNPFGGSRTENEQESSFGQTEGTPPGGIGSASFSGTSFGDAEGNRGGMGFPGSFQSPDNAQSPGGERPAMNGSIDRPDMQIGSGHNTAENPAAGNAAGGPPAGMPGSGGSASSGSVDIAQTILLLLASAVVLIAAIAAASRYRRR